MPKLTQLTFPELRLATRDAHKLRGYFGRLFQEHSPLLHNHLEGGGLRYAYPLVQYKVIDGLPMLQGISEGAELLLDLFLRVRELDIDGQVYPLLTKDLVSRDAPAGYQEEMLRYRFANPYLALNQDNYARYRQLKPGERPRELNRLLRNHILGALKGLDVWLEADQRVFVDARLDEGYANFKDQRMITFSGVFTANILLPDFIGLGKAVSRGFGAVVAARE